MSFDWQVNFTLKLSKFTGRFCLKGHRGTSNLSISAARILLHKKSGDSDLPSVQLFSSCTNFLSIRGRSFMSSLKPVCNIYFVSLIKGITMYIVTEAVPSASHHK